ncbi:MAG: hypothetical protein IIX85_02690 [Clostridia bacterium]|nr:hypothetical protein [Clostridia bacterium]
MTKKTRRIVWIGSVVLVLALLVGGCAAYLADDYPADGEAISAFVADLSVPRNEPTRGVLTYGSPDASVGFISYPGGKVDFRAYEPLMAALASEGALCVLLQMPFQLAVLDVNAAQGFAEEYPAVDQWYLGGHSLGGSMAAAYLEANFSEFAGLVLLGSYSTADLSQTPLRVLSLYGSEDRVMNREKYDRYKSNLPEALTEIVLEGGCHAGFGMYGAQKGDGVPTVSTEEQIDRSADLIFRFMQGEN